MYRKDTMESTKSHDWKAKKQSRDCSLLQEKTLSSLKSPSNKVEGLNKHLGFSSNPQNGDILVRLGPGLGFCSKTKDKIF